ncbi:MAG TPA: M1 family aminopeptidase, partial [Candidatus Acidoferrum sp.]|nr:M1 family aminopeptidase [Candidatus Acidoferrum sp.]
VMETLSQLYHPYEWPVMRLVDCYSGMEFPMLVQIGGDGSSPGFHVVVYHEIAHNWFMGQVGSNQTDRPFLDEGFTTHAEHVVMEKYLGRKGNMDEFETWYARKFAPHEEDRDVRGFMPLFLMMYEGYDKPMVFSYDQGEEYFPYRVSAYYKTAAMHYALRSILGDSAYFAAMRQYCKDWFFKHPYEDDFAASMKAATHLELTPYFDQWFYSRSRLDYAFGGLTTTHTPQGYEHRITIKNKGRFVSPIDVAVVFEQGDTTIYTIPPEGMEYAKPNCVLLPVWNQFRRFDEEYAFTIRAQRRIKKVVIDPNNLLLDVDRMNNASGYFPPTEIRLDNMKYDNTLVDKYALRLRPDLWYDDPNGAQIGFHAHGAYLAQDSVSLDARIGTKSGLPSINYRFAIPLVKANAGPVLIGHAVRSDYRAFSSLAFERIFKPLYSLPDNQYVRFEVNCLNVGGDQLDRQSPITGKQTKYLPYPYWDAGFSIQFAVKAGALWTFHYGSFAVSSSNLVGSSNITDIGGSWGETNNRAELNLTRNQKTRLHLSAEILSQSGEPPAQFLYDLSRVQPYRAFVESQVFRTPGTYPDKWSTWFYPADSRVRGYQERFIPLMRSVGGSIEVTPPDLLPYSWFGKIPLIGKFLSKIDQSFFCDAASVSMKGKQSIYQPMIADNNVLDSTGGTFFMSAGISFSAPPVWSNHHIRLDFPLYLNKPAAGDKEFAFRASVAWILPLAR